MKSHCVLFASYFVFNVLSLSGRASPEVSSTGECISDFSPTAVVAHFHGLSAATLLPSLQEVPKYWFL